MAYFATPPLSIIDRPANAQHTSGTRLAADIRYIVLHSTVGGLQSSLDWLTVNPNSNVSTHRLVVEWYGLYGALPILSHAEIDTKGKTDPAGLPWSSFYRMLFVRLGQLL